MRYTNENGVSHVRVLEPFEYFRLQGWDDLQWRAISPVERSSDFYELCANLAGNSYSLFHFG
eukprot:8689722-Lingulodinium_polyedra.AAC.1